MSHVWGLFSHPDREMQVINRENETISHHYTHHVLLMAAIPVICAFIGTTQIGWNFGDGTILKLSWFTGLALAVLFYGVMLAGVAVMGRVIWWMARNYPQRPSLAHCMVFAGYVATPLFLSGLVALYPLVWLCALVGTVATKAMELAKTFMPVEIRPIPQAELDSVREMMILGTAHECIGVTHFEGRPIGDGKTGPVAHKLRKLIREDLLSGGEAF